MNDTNHRFNANQILGILSSLDSAFAIYTTKDIIIETANDAMIAFWGKDQSVIGRPLEEAVPELVGQPFKKMLQQVLATGITDEGFTPASLMANGQLQTFYYEYKYQAIKDASGTPYCILHTASDVTERELSKLKLLEAKELEEAQKKALLESESRFRSLVEQAPVAIAVFKTHDLLIDIVNNNMIQTWGKTKNILGKPLAEAMPELEGQPFVKILQDVITSGKPYNGSESWAQIMRDGKLVEGWFNFICQPIRNKQGDVDSVLQVVTDVTEQVAARKALQEAQDKLNLALDAAELGLWSTDLITGTLVISERARFIHGLAPDVPITMAEAVLMIVEPYREQVTQRIADAIKNRNRFNLEYPIDPMGDEPQRWLRANGIAYYDEQGVPLYITGTMLDITEQKQDEQRKNDFIGMVSHELKTPLTSLNGYLQMLEIKSRSLKDPFIPGALDKSVRQVKKMTTMINSFLNVSRLEAGKIHIDRQRFDMAQLIKEVEEESVATISSHQVIFAPVEETFVDADRDKIGQVINNFISNAVKYSPNGSTIRAACVKIGDNTQVSVSDEGMGIKPEDQNMIFDRYYRVESKFTQTISGFGIGLYICSEIIQRHEGRIWLESEMKRGSTFYFSLPLA